MRAIIVTVVVALIAGVVYVVAAPSHEESLRDAERLGSQGGQAG